MSYSLLEAFHELNILDESGNAGQTKAKKLIWDILASDEKREEVIRELKPDGNLPNFPSYIVLHHINGIHTTENHFTPVMLQNNPKLWDNLALGLDNKHNCFSRLKNENKQEYVNKVLDIFNRENMKLYDGRYLKDGKLVLFTPQTLEQRLHELLLN